MKPREVDTRRISRCRYCHRFKGKNHNENHCVVNGWEDNKVRIVTEEECENCAFFDSKYIEYPLTINGIENEKIDISGLEQCGCLCEIRPCGEEYKGRTYIGIYIGEIPISIISSYNKNTGILSNGTMNNPAILVPALRKIIYGCESWWREIKNIEDFKEITDNDISNTWYVQLLSSLNGEVNDSK